jgi:hypothetical protein
MISGAIGEVGSHGFMKTLPKVGNKLRTMIGDNSFWNTVKAYNVSKI